MECCKFLSVQKGGFFASFTDSARDRGGQRDSQTEILEEVCIKNIKNRFLLFWDLLISSPISWHGKNGYLPNLSFDLSSLCLAGTDIAYIIS
jgi:hypothetical protein